MELLENHAWITRFFKEKELSLFMIWSFPKADL